MLFIFIRITFELNANYSVVLLNKNEFMLVMTEKCLKTCPRCASEWNSIEELLSDPKVVFMGYQVNFQMPKLGYFLFNHLCGTTFALFVQNFSHLYSGEISEERKENSPECPGYCSQKSSFNNCPINCECAYILEIINTIKNYPKATNSNSVA